MNNVFPKVPLGEILTKSEEWIDIKPDEQYRQITVKLWGKGVVLRDEVSGTEIAATRRIVVKSKQFILSRIDARNGAFGLIPDSLDRAVVSSDFPVFTLNCSRILPEFLDWMSKTYDFVDLCKAASEGTTNRVRLKEERFLATEIPLPSLEEQHRIVARIEELATRIEEARGLKQEVREDCDVLCRSILSDTSDEAPVLMPMRELVKLRELDITVSPEEVYWFAGVYSFGKGLFRGQRKRGMEFSYNRLTRLKAGNFVYPKLMAWEGAFALVPSECDGLVVSPEFPVFEIDQQRLLPETLEVYFHIPSVWLAVSGASTGTNVRRRRLNPADFLAFEIPLPPMKTQKRLREVKSKSDQINQLQAKTSAELDALLPSILDKAFKGEL
jgi:type I restriction enzyme S subunit